jgi:hypothetical protein
MIGKEQFFAATLITLAAKSALGRARGAWTWWDLS